MRRHRVRRRPMASLVERSRRAFWLYHWAPGDRARRSILSEASCVHQASWRASRASAADLLLGDRRLFSGGPVPQPARPSVMSQPLKSRTRQARGPTAPLLPQPAPFSFAHSTRTQHAWMVVPRALRANYDHQPGTMRFLIDASAPMTPLKWKSRRWDDSATALTLHTRDHAKVTISVRANG
jgi:hypothetical protein